MYSGGHPRSHPGCVYSVTCVSVCMCMCTCSGTIIAFLIKKAILTMHAGYAFCGCLSNTPLAHHLVSIINTRSFKFCFLYDLLPCYRSAEFRDFVSRMLHKDPRLRADCDALLQVCMHTCIFVVVPCSSRTLSSQLRQCF